MNSILIWPGIVGPVPSLVVTLVDLFGVVKSLGPEFTIGGRSLASLLTPVGEEGGKLTLTGLFEGIFKVRVILCRFRGLVTEGRES